MKHIILRNTATGITASIFRNGKPDPETLRLFGTHTLPTAWTGGTADEVVRKIEALNPGAYVEFI